MSKCLAVIALTLVLALSAAAQARSPDMFDDEGVTAGNRPRVPSDQYYGYTNRSDLFPDASTFTQNKDMFNNSHPPVDVGVEQRFKARSEPPPQNPIFRPYQQPQQ